MRAYCLTRLHALTALHQLPLNYEVVGMKEIEKEISRGALHMLAHVKVETPAAIPSRQSGGVATPDFTGYRGGSIPTYAPGMADHRTAQFPPQTLSTGGHSPVAVLPTIHEHTPLALATLATLFAPCPTVSRLPHAATCRLSALMANADGYKPDGCQQAAHMGHLPTHRHSYAHLSATLTTPQIAALLPGVPEAILSDVTSDSAPFLTGHDPPVPVDPATLVHPDVLQSILDKYSDIITDGLPPCLPPDRGIGHTILIEPGHNPPFRRNKRVSPAELAVCKEYITDLLSKGLITPSTSPYGAAVMFVAKKNGGFRVCCDWRMLNKITVKNRYPLPRIDETLDALSGATVFSSLDLCSGYFQIRITDEDAHKTAFTTPLGHYEFKVLGQGLANSPATFQSVMNRVFAKQLGKFVVIYLDDIMVFSKSPEEHAQHLEEVLSILQSEKFYADKNKCHFNCPEVEFLGHIVGRDGLKVNPKKIQTVAAWPVP